MSTLDVELNRRLAELRKQDLFRQLRRIGSPQGSRIQVEGKTLLNFSSNDYLGLANHPLLKEASIRAIELFGAGTGASRLISGSLAPHHELEERLAAFKDTEAALTFSTGYAAAFGILCALTGKDDIIVLDKLVHASIVDAAKLSGATLRVFAHNDLNDLESKLKWASQQRAGGPLSSRILIVTESVFSMDGDHAPLVEIAQLKEQYDAWLMVDEAHATGLYGRHRRGLIEERGLSSRVEVQMGTLGKALGASGGYVCGSRTLIDYLVNRARSFIFSTAPVPAAAAAATAALDLVQADRGRELAATLWERVSHFRSLIPQAKTADRSAITPLILGESAAAVSASAALREAGVFVPAIRYPTVPRGSARLRITFSAAHSQQDIHSLADAVTRLIRSEPQPANADASPGPA